jgi:ABC-type transporter Mla maintaining outer membrane lipid asymmetry permease subunit MlaE
MSWLAVPREWIGSFGDIVRFCARVLGEVFGLRVFRFYKGMTATGGAAGVGRAVNQAVVIATLGVFAFNYVFTQTLLATHPEILNIR